MTMAVCFRCGVIKFGAFVPCRECDAMPDTDDEFVLSLAMTDHYFNMATLEQMGASVRDGKPPHLDPESRGRLLEQLRETGVAEQIRRMQRAKPAPDGPSSPAPESVKKPWWHFW